MLNDYRVRFYDEYKLMREDVICASSLKEAISIAMKSFDGGMFSFDTIKIRYLG